MSFGRHTLLMVPANVLLQRPCYPGGLLTRGLQRSARSVVFATYRPPPISCSRPLSTKSPSPPPQGRKHGSIHAHSLFEEGNLPYMASFNDKGKLTIPPAKHLAIGSFIKGSRRRCLETELAVQ